MADWSLLPKDLLERINGHSETCFATVHFRSVCSSWPSAVPLPGSRPGLAVNTLLPIFNDNPQFKRDKHCILKKIPISLMRFQTPFDDDYLLAGVREGKSVVLATLFHFHFGYVMILITIFDIDIVICSIIETVQSYIAHNDMFPQRVAFLPLDIKDDGDFAVLAGVLGELMMYRSCDKRWMRLKGLFRIRSYRDMVSFKGKFYVVDMSGRGHVFVIEPSLEVNDIYSSNNLTSVSRRDWLSQETSSCWCSNLSQECMVVNICIRGWFRLFRFQEVDEKRWVWVIDLEDRALFLGFDWNLCYSAKKLPGMKGNCVYFNELNLADQTILVFDLGTRKTSKASEWTGDIGVFSNNYQSLMECRILTEPIPSINVFDVDSDVGSE
ncbi:hypothetical protein EUTSA_v10023062mg [Eutrema salsugineum]|uniref:KIB1-4 beta-propeller domain-containing protein n=1 Tax=Eutrema salsugineum TaxID=72664 RepID=V4LKN5_EUTSA|nr:hypothetical protein EUTSA_v10023062mg [Eutrema salsugineum]